jgi:hypothetical protein
MLIEFDCFSKVFGEEKNMAGNIHIFKREFSSCILGETLIEKYSL